MFKLPSSPDSPTPIIAKKKKGSDYMLGESPCIIFTCGFVYNILKNRVCV